MLRKMNYFYKKNRKRAKTKLKIVVVMQEKNTLLIDLRSNLYRNALWMNIKVRFYRIEEKRLLFCEHYLPTDEWMDHIFTLKISEH